MLCAPADETSVSCPVAVTRSKIVVSLLVAVSWLVEFVVSNEVLNVVVVSALVVADVPSAVSVDALVSNVVAVDALVPKVVVVDLDVLKEVVKLVVAPTRRRRRIWYSYVVPNLLVDELCKLPR